MEIMDTTLKRLFPYIIILLGLFLLFFLKQAEIAGVFLLVGIVMAIERIWPEKWGTDKKD
jgi:hypothetical protein